MTKQGMHPPERPLLTNVWLDDERDPVDHGYADACWFRDAPAMIAWLKKYGMDDIGDMSLDHDLGSGALTGYDVLVWIEQAVASGKKPPRHIYIHTQNPSGKERMRAARARIYDLADQG